MRRLLMLVTVAVAVASASITPLPLRAGAARSADLATSSPPSATVASPVPYFVIVAGGFLLLSFVLVLIGPRNDHRR